MLICTRQRVCALHLGCVREEKREEWSSELERNGVSALWSVEKDDQTTVVLVYEGDEPLTVQLGEMEVEFAEGVKRSKRVRVVAEQGMGEQGKTVALMLPAIVEYCTRGDSLEGVQLEMEEAEIVDSGDGDDVCDWIATMDGLIEKRSDVLDVVLGEGVMQCLTMDGRVYVRHPDMVLIGASVADAVDALDGRRRDGYSQEMCRVGAVWSALLHEFGHLLGLPHHGDGVMRTGMANVYAWLLGDPRPMLEGEWGDMSVWMMRRSAAAVEKVAARPEVRGEKGSVEVRGVRAIAWLRKADNELLEWREAGKEDEWMHLCERHDSDQWQLWMKGGGCVFVSKRSA